MSSFGISDLGETCSPVIDHPITLSLYIYAFHSVGLSRGFDVSLLNNLFATGCGLRLSNGFFVKVVGGEGLLRSLTSHGDAQLALTFRKGVFGVKPHGFGFFVGVEHLAGSLKNFRIELAAVF